MKTYLSRKFGKSIIRILPVFILSSCTAIGIGDVESVNTATDLAIDCKYDESLVLINKAGSEGGIMSYLAHLEYIAILRDAGRTDDADKALDQYMNTEAAPDSTREDIDQSLQETVKSIQEERKKRTGSSVCK